MPSKKERGVASEIILSLYKLVLAYIPLFTMGFRRGIYKSYVDKLSDEAFNVYGVQIVQALCFSKRNSREFKNINQEHHSILNWLPRLNKYRGVLRELIGKQRKKYGLNV